MTVVSHEPAKGQPLLDHRAGQVHGCVTRRNTAPVQSQIEVYHHFHLHAKVSLGAGKVVHTTHAIDGHDH